MAESTIKQFVYRAATQKRIPVSGTFELTPRCNFDCRMCYIRMSAEEQLQRAPELSTAQWLELGRQAVAAGMIYLLITGGEPFLRPDFATIYTEMVKMGVLVSVNTNASCLSPNILAAFREHPPEAVNVTLYGASPETYERLCGVRGGYDATVRAIDAMRSAGVRVRLNATFTTCNVADMEAIVAFAGARTLPIRASGYTFPPTRNGHAACDVCLSPEEQGRTNARFEFLTATPQQRNNRRAQLLAARERFLTNRTSEDLLSEKGTPVTCMAGRGAFWLAWNGDMYPCGMLSGNAATANDFGTMWAKVRDMTAALRLPAACRDCVWRRLCPSCAAVCYTNHGDTAALVEPMCRYMQTFADTFIELVDSAPPDMIEREAPIETDAPSESFVCL